MRTLPITLEKTDIPVSPLIFGHFIEFIDRCIGGGIYDPESPSADREGIRQDVLEKVQGLRPTILRWPGGTYANIYHWKDGIGPVEKRRKRKNLIWGGVEDHRFGTAEFIRYCRSVGAEPMLCVNMASGTAEEAAEWVEYCNGESGTYYADLRVRDGFPEPFGVKYWCIGNESYAEPDLGAQHLPGRYVEDGWEFVKHMKLMDPTIRLVFVGALEDEGWTREALEAFGPVCDYLSLHHYSAEGDKGPYGSFASLLTFRKALEDFLPLLHEMSGSAKPLNPWYRFPGREAPIRLAVDEWNIWNSAKKGPDDPYGLRMKYTWRDALWTGMAMNTFIAHAEDIGITNLAQLVNVLAPIMTSGDKSYVQTTYHVLKLYRDWAGEKLMRCSFTSPSFDAGKAGMLPEADVCATLQRDGTAVLFVTCLGREEVTLSLPAGYTGEESVVLTALSLDAVNTPGQESVRCTRIPLSGASVRLPPESVCAIRIKPTEEA
ncbi:MAG: hypothetical protein IJ229_08260 [Clostridia bacterium]|nr:hypothetical protein [Clostridia bacterium]MBR1686788.1 hypothetical protein [Clostridia bacterium]